MKSYIALIAAFAIATARAAEGTAGAATADLQQEPVCDDGARTAGATDEMRRSQAPCAVSFEKDTCSAPDKVEGFNENYLFATPLRYLATREYSQEEKVWIMLGIFGGCMLVVIIMFFGFILAHRRWRVEYIDFYAEEEEEYNPRRRYRSYYDDIDVFPPNYPIRPPPRYHPSVYRQDRMQELPAVGRYPPHMMRRYQYDDHNAAHVIGQSFPQFEHDPSGSPTTQQYYY